MPLRLWVFSPTMAKVLISVSRDNPHTGNDTLAVSTLLAFYLHITPFHFSFSLLLFSTAVGG